MTYTKQQRNSTVEILRIMAILMVIISHISFHGFYTDERYNWIVFPFNRWFLQWTNLGSLGVDVFVMISGYYLINNQYVNIRKVSNLIAEIVFYSLLIYLMAILFNISSFNPIDFVRSLFPTTFGSYWFFTSYITIYLLHPYINSLFLHNYSNTPQNNERTQIQIIAIFLMLWCIPHTFLGADLYAGEICQFVMFYCIGAFIRLYGNNISSKSKNLINIYGKVMIGIWLLLPLIGLFLDNYVHVFGEHITYFYSRNSLLTILVSAYLVWYSVNLPMTSFPIVNWFSSSIFGIYLITDNYLVRTNIYESLFHLKQYGNSVTLVPIVLIVTILLFFVPLLVDKVGGAFYKRLGLALGRLVEQIISRFNIALDKLQ